MGSLRPDQSQRHIKGFWLLHAIFVFIKQSLKDFLCKQFIDLKKTDYTQMHFEIFFFVGILAPSPIILFYWENCLETN